MREDEDLILVSSEMVWKVPSYSPHRLIIQSEMFEEITVQGYRRAKHKTYSPPDNH